jgi:hypothetical protein
MSRAAKLWHLPLMAGLFHVSTARSLVAIRVPGVDRCTPKVAVTTRLSRLRSSARETLLFLHSTVEVWAAGRRPIPDPGVRVHIAIAKTGREIGFRPPCNTTRGRNPFMSKSRRVIQGEEIQRVLALIGNPH